MTGAPTPDPFSARQLQAVRGVIQARLNEAIRPARAEQARNLRLAKTVRVGGAYPATGDTFAIRFVDAGFSPLAAGSSMMIAIDRTAEGDTDDAPDVYAREINGRYIPEGSYVSALWQRGLAGDPANYGEWWVRWPTGPEPDPECWCTVTTTDHCYAPLWVPTIYRMTVPPLTNNTCGSCDLWSGDQKLCWKSLPKRWESSPIATTQCGHAAGDPLWRLEKVGANYELQAMGLDFKWRKSASSWQCTADNTMNLAYPLPVPAPCGNIPPTILLRSCIACGHCLDMPLAVTVTIGGATNTGICFESPGCVGFNSSHILPVYSTISCIWRKQANWWCTPGLSPQYDLYARIGATATELYWDVTLSYWALAPWPVMMTLESCSYRWYSGSLNPFDCQAHRTLAYHASAYGTPPSCNLDTLTVTIN